MSDVSRNRLWVPSRRGLFAGAGGLAATALLPRTARASTAADPWDQARAIADRVRAPVFPARVFNVVDHGAKGDGTTKNSAAFASAIKACSAAGGGRVLVPAGRFLTGPVRLLSNVELHLVADATLLFSTDTADYPLVHTRWEGVELMNYSPLIYAYREKNIAVTGKGTLDGQADTRHWWVWKGKWEGTTDSGWREGMPSQRPSQLALWAQADSDTPVEKRVYGDGHYLRPPLIQPYDCENVLIEGVKLRRSPFWQVHPVLCRNIIVRGLDILGHGPNNDGVDPECCRDMIIEDVVFDTGDDCIAIKSGRNGEGRKFGIASEDILIRDCVMKEGHAGIAIGSEISGGVRRVFGERCRMDSPELWHAIRFKNNAMRGGLLEDCHYRDIDVGQVGRSAIQADFNYTEGANGPFKPVLRDVVIERLRVANAVSVLDAQGLPGAPVERITIRDSSFLGVTKPSVIRHVEGLTLDNVRVNGAKAESL
jgi:polygalacturonase